MNIDVNMDWLPNKLFTDEALLESFIHIVPRAYGEFARLDNVPGKDIRQIIIEKPRGFANLNYVETQYNLEDQLKDMDAAGIDKAILQIPCWQEWLDLETSKRVNDGLARHIEQAPDRFLALAVAPPWGTKECLYEVDRCLEYRWPRTTATFTWIVRSLRLTLEN
jgi:predicted TIM-barrel fold metal-dependent hydrolase